MSIRRAALAAVPVALACALASAPAVHGAQELTVSPLIVELDAEAGDTLTEQVTATASGDEAITVELVHADFGFGEDYQVVLINDDAPETTAFSTRGWFSLPKERYRIPAGQSRQLPLRIEVPENTPGGTYLGAALLRIVPPESDGGGSQVQAVPQSGPLLFIAVEGGEPPKPKVDRFELPRIQRSGPIRPDLVVGNDGDEFFTLEGTVRLTGPGRDDEVDVRHQFVVPDEPREIRAAAEDGASDEGPLRLGTSDLPIGRYEVTSRLRVEPTGTTLVSRRTVWIVPTWAWIIGVLGLAGVVGSAYMAIRAYRNREELAPVLGDAPPIDDDDEVEDEDVVDDEDVDEYDVPDEEELDEFGDDDEESLDRLS